MNIADAVSKEKYLTMTTFPGHSKREHYEDLTWAEIIERYTAEHIDVIKKEHQLIFEKAFKILQNVPDVPSFLKK